MISVTWLSSSPSVTVVCFPLYLCIFNLRYVTAHFISVLINFPLSVVQYITSYNFLCSPVLKVIFFADIAFLDISAIVASGFCGRLVPCVLRDFLVASVLTTLEISTHNGFVWVLFKSA